MVYLSFKINQDYIAKNLCVEKDVEGSTCKGCCHLSKKVNEQQEQKKNLPPNQSEKQNINFCAQNSGLNLHCYSKEKNLVAKAQTIYLYLNPKAIFHPPRPIVS